MRYLFFVASDRGDAEAWWVEVAGGNALTPEADVFGYHRTDEAAFMLARTGAGFACCVKSEEVAVEQFLPAGAPFWGVDTDDRTPSPGTALVLRVSGSVDLVLNAPGETVDDLVWYDPAGEMPVRLLRALLEYDAIRGRRDDWAPELTALLPVNRTRLLAATEASDAAETSIQTGRPLKQSQVRSLLASDTSLVSSLSTLRDLRMRASLEHHANQVRANNIAMLLGAHHVEINNQLLGHVGPLHAQSEHDLALISFALEQLEAAQGRATMLFDRSRYITDAAREATAALQGALFAAVGIALTLIQVLALPNVRLPPRLAGQIPLLVSAAASASFIAAISLSYRAIGRRSVFLTAVVLAASIPLTVIVAMTIT